MTLNEKIMSATASIELIGYREDAERLPIAQRDAALRLIQDKFEQLRCVPGRRVFRPEKTKSIKNLFGKHVQVSAPTDPDYGGVVTTGLSPRKERKK